MKTNQLRRAHVAILDDHFIVRNGYKEVLKDFPYISKVSLFNTGAELMSCLARNAKNNIDLVLLNIILKNENGLDLCQEIKNRYKHKKVLMISTDRNVAHIIRAEQYGSDGYLFKDADYPELRKAFDLIILEGHKYFSTEAKEIVFDFERKFNETSSINRNGKELTQKEKQILHMICDGYSNREIAGVLNRAESTIEKHRQNIMKKTESHKITDLIKYAIHSGLYV